MPRSALAAAFALVIVLAAVPYSARAGEPVAHELLADGGFESGIGAWATTHGQLDTVPTPVHEGAGAARLSGAALQSHEVYRPSVAAPGQPYELSGWILLNDPGLDRVFLRISWFNANGGLISQSDSLWLTIAAAEYQQLSTGAVVAPLAAASARVGVKAQANSPFDLYLDDLSFTGAIPPPPTPSPAPSATPAPTPASTATPAPATTTPRPSATAQPHEEPDVFDTLTNGGFESSRTDGSPYAWRDIGADLTTISPPVVEGSRALAVTSRSASTKWAYQTVRIHPGEFYDAAGHTWSSGAAETFLRVSWYATPDGSGAAIDSVDSTAVSQAESRWEALATGPVQAPGAAQTAKLRLMLRPGSDSEITAYFDAVSFGSTNGRPPAGVTAPSGSQVSGGGVRAGAGAAIEPDDPPGAIVERYPLGFANVKPAATAGPAAVSGSRASYDWLAVLGLLAGGGVIAFGAFLEWSHRRIAAGEEAP